MRIHLKGAKIIYPGHELNGKIRDIKVERGKVIALGRNLPQEEKYRIVDKCHLSPSWVDLFAWQGEPGFEHRETIDTLCQTGAAGGFAHIFVSPETSPCIDNSSIASYLESHTAVAGCKVYPLGALSKGCKGQDLSEMHDMVATGVKAFTDGTHPCKDAGLMMRALEYSKGCNGVIMNMPLDWTLAMDGHMHEGVESAQLGMRGIPALAEELMLKRDLDLLDYTGGRLHVLGLSSDSSIKILKRYKGTGLTASVAAHNLFHRVEKLAPFDQMTKVLPPVRTKKDSKALLKALKEGTIMAIHSSHMPLDEEQKKLEFCRADFGMIQLQTLFANLWTKYQGEISLDNIVNWLALGPRQILNLEPVLLEEGKPTDLTIFDPKKKWTFSIENNHSKSVNSPYLNKEYQGQAVGLINKNGSFLID